MDAALHAERGGDRSLTSRSALAAEFDRMLPFRGSTPARRALAFADGLADNPGESLSRVRIHELRFPAPSLQQVFVDREGRMIVDFWWPEYRLVGEFDGLVKYHRAEYMSGRTIEGVVIAEKRREDRLRRLDLRVARWVWDEALAARPLEAILLGAGLPQGC